MDAGAKLLNHLGIVPCGAGFNLQRGFSPPGFRGTFFLHHNFN